jgi:hypothetical protein
VSELPDAPDHARQTPEVPERPRGAHRSRWKQDISVPEAVFGLLCAFVSIYCLIEDRWEPLAALALILAAFAVAMGKMVDEFEVGQKGLKGRFRRPSVKADYEVLNAEVEDDSLKPPQQGPESAPEKGSPED